MPSAAQAGTVRSLAGDLVVASTRAMAHCPLPNAALYRYVEASFFYELSFNFILFQLVSCSVCATHNLSTLNCPSAARPFGGRDMEKGFVLVCPQNMSNHSCDLRFAICVRSCREVYSILCVWGISVIHIVSLRFFGIMFSRNVFCRSLLAFCACALMQDGAGGVQIRHEPCRQHETWCLYAT